MGLKQTVHVQIKGRGFTADEHLDCDHRTLASRVSDWVKRVLRKYNTLEGGTLTVRIGEAEGLEPLSNGWAEPPAAIPVD